MKNSRRELFTKGIGALCGGAILFCGNQTWAEQDEIKLTPYRLSNRPCDRLLQQCGDTDSEIAIPAWKKICKSLAPQIISEVQRRTGLTIKERMMPVVQKPGLNNIDIGSSLDWKFIVAREKKWNFIKIALEVLIQDIVLKVNECKTPTSYIYEVGFYDDECLNRQRRFGCYMWLELTNTKDYRTN